MARFQAFITSIRTRITLWFIAVLAIVLVVFSAAVYTLQARAYRQETLDRLSQKINNLSSLDRFSRQEIWGNPGSNDPETETLLVREEILAVINLRGQVVQKYGPITDADVNRLALHSIEENTGENPFSYTFVSASTTNRPISRQYIFLVSPITLGPAVIGFLILGSPVDPGGQLHRLLLSLIAASAGTLAIATAGGFWLATRAMRPVKKITEAARQISDTDLSLRLNLRSKDEIGLLGETFDEMLSRLESAFERQRQFTADASHELRTPITIINLESARALSKPDDLKGSQSALKVIKSENEYMTRLVNNLLTLSRMDAGQIVLHREAVDLSDIALEVVERLSPVASSFGVAIETGDLPEVTISGDRQYLIQMLSNIVENAVKYSPPEQGCVCITTGIESEYAWIKIEDNGPGIAPEHLKHIFDRFYQVDPARSRADTALIESQPIQTLSGSGLGLSIVQWIVGSHGGSVLVKSTPGLGSTFIVQLPTHSNPTVMAN